MKDKTNTLLEAALSLPPRKRARIAERLLRSLDGPEPTAEELARIDAAWTAEIERRVKEIDDGTAELIPAEHVFAEVRTMLGKTKKRKTAS